MTNIPLYIQFFFAGISTIGFAVFFNCPLVSLLPAGITGAIGWCIFIVLRDATFNVVFANFIAAIFVSTASEILARKMKQPAILFVIPGIIPLVPGLSLYNTMLYLVQKDYNTAIATGADSLFVSVAIALGVLVITSLARTIRIVNIRRRNPLIRKRQQ